MAVVSLKIGSRFYKFSCADGQEAYMNALGENLDARAEKLLKTIGFMQEGQLLAMLCLLLAEEKTQLEKNVQVDLFLENKKQIVDSLNVLSERMSSLADGLMRSNKEE